MFIRFYCEMYRLRSSVVLLFNLLIASFIVHSVGQLNSGRIPPHRITWALLIAGSNGYGNYRHQADICHAYQLLIAHGISEHRIITMMYDDIANNLENPYLGYIFNRPYGPDVYAGVKIDYRGDDITPESVLAVLSGNASAVANMGNGRVIDSNEKDNIFVYYADHGGTGMIAVMNDVLYANDLLRTLINMHDERRFNNLVFYLEACESGSMFLDLPSDMNIYAVTAANADESSWGTYCDSPMPMLDVCLGDEFSVSWMETADKENLQLTQLILQYNVVKKLVKESHVCRFGDMTMGNYLTAEFMGWATAPKQAPLKEVQRVSWPSRNISLMIARRKYENAIDEETKKIMKERLDLMIQKREYLDNFMNQFAGGLVNQNEANAVQKLREIFKKRSAAQKQHECYKKVTNAFIKKCFNYGKNPYAASYSHVLANLCEFGYQSDQILNRIDEMCQTIKMNDIH